MTLLFDENLSFRLVGPLSQLFPNSRHVRDVGLSRADDRDIWEFAQRERLAIGNVSLTAIFNERSVLYGWPSKVIWLQAGNTATRRSLPCVISREQPFAALGFACLGIGPVHSLGPDWSRRGGMKSITVDYGKRLAEEPGEGPQPVARSDYAGGRSRAWRRS